MPGSKIDHKSCKRAALRKINRVQKLLWELIDMVNDKCPAVKNIYRDDVELIQLAVTTMKWRIEEKEK